MPVFQLFPPAYSYAVAKDHDYRKQTPEDNFLERMLRKGPLGRLVILCGPRKELKEYRRLGLEEFASQCLTSLLQLKRNL